MSSELSPVKSRPPVPSAESLWPKAKEGESVTRVGVVIFNEGHKAIFLTKHNDILQTNTVTLPKGLNANNFTNGSERVLHLENSTNVQICRIGFEDTVSVAKDNPADRNSSFSVITTYTDPKTHMKAKLALSEKDVFDVFTKEKGKLFAFQGGGELPTHTMVVEELVGKEPGVLPKQNGTVFVFDPTRESSAVDSERGLKTYLDRLSRAFKEVQTPLQEQVLAALEREESPNLASDIRNAVFKLQCLAHARFRNMQFIEQHFPHLKSDLRSQVSTLLRLGIGGKLRTSTLEERESVVDELMEFGKRNEPIKLEVNHLAPPDAENLFYIQRDFPKKHELL